MFELLQFIKLLLVSNWEVNEEDIKDLGRISSKKGFGYELTWKLWTPYIYIIFM